MERIFEEYTKWRQQDLPEDLQLELAMIADNEDEIYSRFCKAIRFGTSGLRGKMGAGTNYINSVTLRRASLAVARCLHEKALAPKVLIAYDTRRNSRVYAEGVAEVLAQRGVDVLLFDEPTPVPVLSFAVSHLGLSGGIVLTASHNPKEYNGYKLYDHCGNQIDETKAALIETYMREADPFAAAEPAEHRGTIGFVGEEVKQAYLNAVCEQIVRWQADQDCRKAMSSLKVCYTPLNGAGYPYVTVLLQRLGLVQLVDVECQKEPDGRFPTCPKPNPELAGAFTEAVKAAEADAAGGGEPADIILATDPDSDRLGVMAYHKGEYVQLTGNQVGELLFDYICRARKDELLDPDSGRQYVAYKSLVSSPLTRYIGLAYNVEVRDVFTGFKNIAAELETLKAQGREKDFVFGFEESLGYLYGTYARDKDGVLAAATVCLLAAQLKAEGQTLLQRLEEIYHTYGYLQSMSYSFVYEHERDRAKIDRAMTRLFAGELKKAKTTEEDGFAVEDTHYYLDKKVFCAALSGGHQLIVRPSGTELKLKTYIFSKGETLDEAEAMSRKIFLWIRDFLRKAETDEHE